MYLSTKSYRYSFDQWQTTCALPAKSFLSQPRFPQAPLLPASIRFLAWIDSVNLHHLKSGSATRNLILVRLGRQKQGEGRYTNIYYIHSQVVSQPSEGTGQPVEESKTNVYPGAQYCKQKGRDGQERRNEDESAVGKIRLRRYHSLLPFRLHEAWIQPLRFVSLPTRLTACG